MPHTNADRTLHGQSAQEGLEYILQQCQDANYIVRITNPYRVGREGYNPSQFYAPFLIQFHDETCWALFTTTSMRTDRVKGQQWDALNLKEINTAIQKVYLVYPDGLSDSVRDEFVRQHNKYINGDEYSAIDDVVSQDQMRNIIQQNALRALTAGQMFDQLGTEYEIRVVSILNYPRNLEKWKTNAPTVEGMHYDSFLSIVTCLGINPATTTSIRATADPHVIGKLPSGGNPKTDILVTVCNDDETERNYTISCKRSSASSVSVHQYTADAFADVLNREDSELRRLLNSFQQAGNLRDFGQENRMALERMLEPYCERLALWALGGFGGEGTEHQCAGYILTYNDTTGASSIHETYEYYQTLVADGVTGNFGTIFSWTYPSGRRGQSIQLKCKIL